MILSSATELPYTPGRIVSLVPSQTELLYSLGLEDTTIGITKFCVHPEDWRVSKAIIGGTKNIHTDKIIALRPDLIIANKEENVKEQVEELAKDHAVWLTDVNNLPDALQMITDIGTLTNTKAKANELSSQIIAEFSQLSIPASPVSTAYLIWRKPFMTIGGDTFINDMLNRCGLANIFAPKKDILKQASPNYRKPVARYYCFPLSPTLLPNGILMNYNPCYPVQKYYRQMAKYLAGMAAGCCMHRPILSS